MGLDNYVSLTGDWVFETEYGSITTNNVIGGSVELSRIQPCEGIDLELGIPDTSEPNIDPNEDLLEFLLGLEEGD